MRVIHPPQLVGLDDSSARVLFLAGPIQGAPDWQRQAIEMLAGADLVVANPRAPEPWHGDYEGQVDWETWYLRLAAERGVILFWLAVADPTVDQPPGRAYAQTSRFELGEWFGAATTHTEPPFVVGIEPGFSNERYIRRRLGQVWPELVIPGQLDQTVALALARLRG